ncbi:replication-relaxation family protein [Halobacillus sp. Marseille-Q1614]|uniref:replication-relaxation family protein n=1 Tax=Halobacillus sp. Marseille-Q1614 TaxID=2709134 RepID=UPI00156E592E|nr:replication-relaxation family protein [Halobacillus sp. Marseille-Q1614]
MDFLLSEKRKEVLETIDRFGVITNRQLEKFLSYMGVNTIRRGRQQLIELGFIEERSFGRRKVSGITKKGSEYVGQIMTGASSSYSQLQHDLTVNEIVHALMQQYKEKSHSVTFRTEREITRQAFLSLSYDEVKKPNKLRHLSKEVPDFLLIFGDKPFAFEVELNRKTHQRIEKKIKQYKHSLEESTYAKVFYICKDEGIRNHVESFAKGVGVDIQFLMLHEVIDSEEV